MSLFANEGEDEYISLRKQVIDIGKRGYVQSEINKHLVGNPYLTDEIIKLMKIEMMKQVIEMEL